MRDPAIPGACRPHQPTGAADLCRREKREGGRGGKLSNIAPTVLSLMGMEIPQEMTGKPLFIVE